MKSRDSVGNEIVKGDTIRVLEIDTRITEYLPKDEVEEIVSLVGEICVVQRINNDGSMIVSKTRNCQEDREIIGREIAIFPQGALLVN